MNNTDWRFGYRREVWGTLALRWPTSILASGTLLSESGIHVDVSRLSPFIPSGVTSLPQRTDQKSLQAVNGSRALRRTAPVHGDFHRFKRTQSVLAVEDLQV